MSNTNSMLRNEQLFHPPTTFMIPCCINMHGTTLSLSLTFSLSFFRTTFNADWSYAVCGAALSLLLPSSLLLSPVSPWNHKMPHGGDDNDDNSVTCWFLLLCVYDCIRGSDHPHSYVHAPPNRTRAYYMYKHRFGRSTHCSLGLWACDFVREFQCAALWSP